MSSLLGESAPQPLPTSDAIGSAAANLALQIVDFTAARHEQQSQPPPPSTRASITSWLEHVAEHASSAQIPAGSVVCLTDAEKASVMAGLAQQAHDTPSLFGSQTNSRAVPQTLIIASDGKTAYRYAKKESHEMFRREAPSLRVATPLYPRRMPTDTADVVVIDEESMEPLIANGTIRPKRYGLVLYDSGNATPNPAVMATRARHRLGTRLINLTTSDPATAGESPLPVIHKNDLVTGIQSGSLNGLQIYSFRTPLRASSEGKLADETTYNERVVDAACALVQKGLRVAIQGQTGEHARHPQRLVEMLRKRTVAAAMVSMRLLSQKQNTQTIRDFNRGDIDVVVSSRTLENRSDIYADAVILAARTEAKNREHFEQLLANHLAPNPDRPVTLFLEFFPVRPDDEKPMASIWNILGAQIITQGKVIGGYRGRDGSQTQFMPVISRDTLPSALQRAASALNHKLVLPATYGPAPNEMMKPLTGKKVTLDELNRVHSDRTRVSIRQQLNTAGFQHDTRIEEVDGRLVRIRYYPVEVAEYLAPPAVSQTTEQQETPDERHLPLHIRFGIHQSKMDEICERLAVVAEKRSHSDTGDEYDHYEPEVLAAIQVEIDAIPVADDKIDISMAQGAKSIPSKSFFMQYAHNPEHGIAIIYKKRADGNGYADHITREEMEKIKQAYKDLPRATSEHTPLQDVVRDTRLTQGTLILKLHPVEQSYIELRASEGSTRMIQYFPRVAGAAVVYRLQPQPLPPYLIPFTAIARRLHHIKEGDLYTQVKDLPSRTLRLPHHRGTAPIAFTWDVLQRLEERFNVPDDAPVIDFSKMPTPDAAEGEDEAYARSIQTLYVKPEQMEQIPAAPRAFINLNQASPAGELMLSARGYPRGVSEGHSSAKKPRVQTQLPRREQYDPPTHLLKAPSRPAVTNTGLTIDDILDRTTADKSAVQKAVEDLKHLFPVPEKVMTDSHHTVTPYSGPHLDAILTTLVGLPAPAMAKRLQVAEHLVINFLQTGKYKANIQGRYSAETWKSVQQEFRHPPEGHRPARQLATPDTSESDIVELAETLGGQVEYFYVGDQKQAFLSPTTRRLIEMQSLRAGSFPVADKNWYNRFELAARAGCSPRQVDEWMARALPNQKQVQWFQPRNPIQNVTFLPHYRADLAKSFLGANL